MAQIEQAGPTNGTYPPIEQVTRTRLARVSNPLLGGSDLLIGANVVPTPAQVAQQQSTNVQPMALFWQDIANNGLAGTSGQWLKNQVTALASAPTQATAVRIIGCSGGINQGFYTLASYIAAWQAVAAYLRSQGFLLYPTLDAGWGDFGTGCISTNAAYPSASDISNMQALATALEQTGTCVALDVVQEYTGGYPSGSTLSAAQAQVFSLVTALRSVTALPLTSSSAITTDGSDLVAAYNPNVEAAHFDFIDRHIYYAAVLPADFAGLYAFIGSAYPNIPILIGECGVPASQSGANRTAFYNAIKAVLRGGRVVGAFAWAIADQDVVNTNQWGLYSGSPGGALTARSDIAAPFLAWPRRKQPGGVHVCGVGNQALANGGFANLQTPATTFDYGGFVPQTAINGASNGQTLPQSTLNVGSTAGFPPSGTLTVATSLGNKIVTYTGVTATTFTGCTGGTGTLSSGGAVTAIGTAFRIPTGMDGLYRITYQVVVQGSSVAGTVRAYLVKNGATDIVDLFGNVAISEEKHYSASAVADCAAGDYFQPYVAPTGGVSGLTTVAGASFTFVSVERIGQL